MPRDNSRFRAAAIEHAFFEHFGVSDGIIGYTEEDEQRIIARRMRELRKLAKEREHINAAFAANTPDLPEGMEEYIVTYSCTHTAKFVLREGFTEADLDEVYGDKLCPACSTEAARARAQSFDERYGA